MPAKELTALKTVTQQLLDLLQGEWHAADLEQRLQMRHQLIENLRQLPAEERMRTGQNASLLMELDQLTLALLEQLRAAQEQIVGEQKHMHRSHNALQAYQGHHESESHFIQQER